METGPTAHFAMLTRLLFWARPNYLHPVIPSCSNDFGSCNYICFFSIFWQFIPVTEYPPCEKVGLRSLSYLFLVKLCPAVSYFSTLGKKDSFAFTLYMPFKTLCTSIMSYLSLLSSKEKLPSLSSRSQN